MFDWIRKQRVTLDQEAGCLTGLGSRVFDWIRKQGV